MGAAAVGAAAAARPKRSRRGQAPRRSRAAWRRSWWTRARPGCAAHRREPPVPVPSRPQAETREPARESEPGPRPERAREPRLEPEREPRFGAGAGAGAGAGVGAAGAFGAAGTVAARVCAATALGRHRLLARRCGLGGRRLQLVASAGHAAHRALDVAGARTARADRGSRSSADDGLDDVGTAEVIGRAGAGLRSRSRGADHALRRLRAVKRVDDWLGSFVTSRRRLDRERVRDDLGRHRGRGRGWRGRHPRRGNRCRAVLDRLRSGLGVRDSLLRRRGLRLVGVLDVVGCCGVEDGEVQLWQLDGRQGVGNPRSRRERGAERQHRRCDEADHEHPRQTPDRATTTEKDHPGSTASAV